MSEQHNTIGPVILVTGLPASGKTTLARFLSEKFQLPLLSKDVIKESLFDSMGIEDRNWSAKLGAASSDILWAILKNCNGGAVVETWLDPTRNDVDYARKGIQEAHPGDVYEIICQCDGDVAAKRYRMRKRHAGHATDEQIISHIQEVAPLVQPLGIGKAFILDTSHEFEYNPLISWLSQELDPSNN